MNVSKRVQVSSNLLSVFLFYVTEGPFFLREHFYSCWSRKSFKQLRRTYWLLFESFCRKFWSLVFWSVSVTAYKARFLYVNEFFSFSNCFVIFTEWYWLLYELIIVLSFALKTWFDLYKMLFGHAWNIKKAATFGNRRFFNAEALSLIFPITVSPFSNIRPQLGHSHFNLKLH